MINPFYKFFKKEVKLAAAEWPLSEPQTEEEIRIKLEDLKRRLKEVNKGKDWNDWTAEDRQMTQRLEEEIVTLEQKLSGGDKQSVEESVFNQSEDSEVKDGLDKLMKKVRG